MVDYFRTKVRPGAGWTYPTGVGPVGGVMSDPNLFYSHVGLGVGSKDFPPYTKAPMHNAPSYVGQVDVGSPYKDVYKKYDVSSKPAGFHHEQQQWIDMQILNSPLNTQGATPEKVYETYMGLGSATPSERQRNKAGRIIEEARASARETRPELFTEPAASGEAILPSQSASNEILPDLAPRDPGVYEPLNINNYVSYGEAVDRPGGHFSERTMPPSDFERGESRRRAEMPFQGSLDSSLRSLARIGGSDSFFVPTREVTPLQQEVSGEQRSTSPLPPEAPQLLDRYGSGYWTNPDTGQVMDIESEMGPQYHSTIPMGYAPYDPNRQTGFFSNLGRRLMSGVTAPYRHFTDIRDVPATGSGIGAAASTFGPALASAMIPGAGLFTLLSRMLPDSGATPYQQEGRNVSDISFGPKMAWLGADVPGGGYYIPNQKIDMAQLGGGRTPGGRGITVHTPEGLVDATYRVDPTGAASITSDDFGAPNVDYGDIYYGGADYEGLDISDDGSGDQWDAYWGDW